MSSVFTSRITSTIEVPHAPGHTVTIRKLAPRQLEEAAKAMQRRSLDDLRAMGGPAFIKELAVLRETGAPELAAQKDPMLLYDRLVLMEKGTQAWTFDAPLEAKSFEDLDEETQDWLGRAVLKLAKPALFETADETEDAQKNG